VGWYCGCLCGRSTRFATTPYRQCVQELPLIWSSVTAGRCVFCSKNMVYAKWGSGTFCCILRGPGGNVSRMLSQEGRSQAEPSRAEPSRAEPSRAEPSGAERSRAERSRAEPSRAKRSVLTGSGDLREAQVDEAQVDVPLSVSHSCV